MTKKMDSKWLPLATIT